MYRCEKHGGHGFVSDCEICNVEKMLTERDKRIASLEAERDAAYNRGWKTDARKSKHRKERNHKP